MPRQRIISNTDTRRSSLAIASPSTTQERTAKTARACHDEAKERAGNCSDFIESEVQKGISTPQQKWREKARQYSLSARFERKCRPTFAKGCTDKKRSATCSTSSILRRARAVTFSTKQMIDRFAGPSFHDGNRLAMRERRGPVKAGPFLAKASNGLRAREDQRPLGRPPPLAGSRRGFRSFAAGPLVQRGATPHLAFHFRGALSNHAAALCVLVALETACVTK